MTRPLRQSVDFKFLRVAETDLPWVAPVVYGRGGLARAVVPPPGSLVNVRV